MNDASGELPFPRTEPALSAMRFARDIEDPAIFNQPANLSLRTGERIGTWLTTPADR